jgi:peptide/nickel transport system substrate-binding protein
VLVAALGLLALLLAACGTTSAAAPRSKASSSSAEQDKVVTWAELPGTSPNWIFPIVPGAQFSVVNLADFIPLMYKSLYNANFNEPSINDASSLAGPPVWSDHDRVVTITLKHYRWTNGQPVTTRDITFFVHLAAAAGSDWGDFEPGAFPSNVASMKIDSPSTMSFTLTKSFNPTYYTDNWLSVIVPLPQSVWDRESLHGKVGNYDDTPAGAKRVWSFLNSYAEKMSTYSDENPIWGVTDGPYRLQSFGQDAAADVFVPNRTYAGHRSIIAKFEELPFTSSSSEYDDLRSGNGAVSVGYVPLHDVPTLSSVRSSGYSVDPVHYWGFAFIVPNLANPTLGAVFRQLYVRQALEHLVDQQAIIKSFFDGYGEPAYGPVPVYPPGTRFLDAAVEHNRYPYSVHDAEQLLASHGWRVVKGVQTCASTRCGAGIKIGTRLVLHMLYSSGSTSSTEEMELYEADAAQAHITIDLQEEPFDTVIGIMDPCTPGVDGITDSSAVCTWQIGTWGGSTYSWTYSLFPSGGQLFVPGSADNSGLYDDPALTRLIDEARSASTLAPFHAYENLAAEQLPYLWLPMADGLAAVAKNLRGPGIVTEYGVLAPNRWYFAN